MRRVEGPGPGAHRVSHRVSQLEAHQEARLWVRLLVPLWVPLLEHLWARLWTRWGAWPRARASVGALSLAVFIGLTAITWPVPASAREAAPASADPVLEARVMRISSELRCLVCQNESIAASHAGLAVDLRNQVREMLSQGKSEREIYDYMKARYGDFVLYRPPLKSATALLWFGPALLLGGGLLGLWLVLRRRSLLAADQFEPDEMDTAAAPAPRQDTAR